MNRGERKLVDLELLGFVVSVLSTPSPNQQTLAVSFFKLNLRVTVSDGTLRYLAFFAVSLNNLQKQRDHLSVVSFGLDSSQTHLTQSL